MSSYPNQTPNLGKLNFEEIKTSLKEYLQSQDSLKDYNFEGSILQTLINVLAYNTYYYGFYSNMVSNEMFLDSAQRTDSVVSLTKPLNYFLPLKTSAKAILNVFGLSNNISEYTLFQGLNSDGIIYQFYTRKAYTIQDSDALNVEIFDAKQLFVNIMVTSSFDQDRQRFFINDQNLDTNSLKVKIQKNGQVNSSSPREEWVFIDNFGSTSVANQNIYYLERANNGVYVLFGKINSLGNSIDGTKDNIFIDYMSVNGSIANNIQEFRLVSASEPNVNIGLVQQSSGGLDQPNLDLAKFAAPRLFGSQNRAVTKDDIRAIVSAFFASSDEFSIFGGDEIFPAMYGRVFFTANLDPNTPSDLVKINQIYNILKEKCVVTVLPEFTLSRNLNITCNLSFALAPTAPNTLTPEQIAAAIKNIMNTIYDSTGKYNFSFNSSDVISYIQKFYPYVLIDDNDFNISYTEGFRSQAKILVNLENEIDIPYFTNFDITNVFLDKLNRFIKLAVYIVPSQNKFDFVRLKVLVRQPSGAFLESAENYGKINIKRGIIEIEDIINSSATMQVSVPFKNSYFKSSLNNKVKFQTTQVQVK